MYKKITVKVIINMKEMNGKHMFNKTNMKYNFLYHKE